MEIENYCKFRCEELRQRQKDISGRFKSAMETQDITAIREILENQEKLDEDWIAASGYRKDVRVRCGGRNMIILEDPTDVINNGIIVCSVRFDDGTTDRVGLAPPGVRLEKHKT